MKRTITKLHLGLLAFTAIFTISCEREKLSDVLVNENKPAVSLAMDNKIEVAGGNNFTLDNNQLTVPIKIDFTGASPKAFTVNIQANTDTIATLIANGTLPAGTVALETGSYNFPAVVNVAYGVQSVTWDLLISRTFLEKFHGKDVAMVVKMTDAAKGNSIATGKNTTIIVVKTGQTIAEEDVHYITFASSRINIPLTGPSPGYSMGSQDITVPLELFLSGMAGPSFTIDVAKSPETVTAAINAGTLTNTVAVESANWGIPNPRVTFEAGKNSAGFTVNIRISNLLAITGGKKGAIGLTLKNPSKYQIGKKDINLIVVLDPDNFRPYNGTPFLIKGGIGQVSDMIPAALYDYGGEGIAFHDDGNKDGTDFRAPDKVDVGDYTPRSVVGWTNSGEWLTYTVYVEEDGEYELNSLIGAPGTNGRYSVFFDDVAITPILESAQTPGSYGDQRPNLTTVQLKKGRHIMKFFMNVGAYDVRGYIFTRKK